MLSDEEQKQRLEEFRERCASRGLRITPQRTEVFRVLLGCDDHPPADVVFERVRERIPNISLDTVYRILYWLEDEGLVFRLPISSDRFRFDGDVEPHHHYVCSDCGAIFDFYSDEVDRIELPPEVMSFGRTDRRHLQVSGMCRDCLEVQPPGAAG